jgi:hypothetical protein
MAYRNFKENDIKDKLHLQEDRALLFHNIEKKEASEFLKEFLKETKKLNPDSEKAISEMIVFPILLELCRRNDSYITIYSGETLNVDKTKGLNGECDFIVSRNTKSLAINTPILTLVEAKGTEKMIKHGIPQCVAQMKGAKLYNEKRNMPINVIYGCVTSGDEWLFLKLEGDTITFDEQKYYISDLPVILGVFQQIIDYYKDILK